MIDKFVKNELKSFLPQNHYIRVNENIVLRLSESILGEGVYELFLEQENVEAGKGKKTYTPLRWNMAYARYNLKDGDIGNAIYKALWTEDPMFEE